MCAQLGSMVHRGTDLLYEPPKSCPHSAVVAMEDKSGFAPQGADQVSMKR